MDSDSDLHRRHSIRLNEYDYTQPGAYFLTLCTQERECLFGGVANGELQLNGYGEIVGDEWLKSAQIRAEISLDEFVVMPNHLHGIVMISAQSSAETNASTNGRVTGPSLAGLRMMRGPIPRSLASLIAGFKSSVTRKINEVRGTPRAVVWQRNYYEHIIRNDETLNRAREYIANNPLKWELDRLRPGNAPEW